MGADERVVAALQGKALGGIVIEVGETAIGALRMAFGGHFFTDVAAAGLVSFFVIWLAYGWLCRWPSTRVSDEQVEAALARWGRPGYRLWQRWRGRAAG